MRLYVYAGFFHIIHSMALKQQLNQIPYMSMQTPGEIASDERKLAKYTTFVNKHVERCETTLRALGKPNPHGALVRKHLCDIEVHRRMIIHAMQVRNAQVRTHRKKAYHLKKLIDTNCAAATKVEYGSTDYPEKKAHIASLQVELAFIDEINRAASSSTYPIIKHIALLIAGLNSSVHELLFQTSNIQASHDALRRAECGCDECCDKCCMCTCQSCNQGMHHK